MIYNLEGNKGMKLRALVFAVLFYTVVMLVVVPAMAQINPPPNFDDPVALTKELRIYVESLDEWLFRGATPTIRNQVRETLLSKIDVVINLFEKGNYHGGCMKLNKDISPKLWICHTAREQARSWLSDDPEMRDEAEVCRDYCQGLIAEINRLADPRLTP